MCRFTDLQILYVQINERTDESSTNLQIDRSTNILRIIYKNRVVFRKRIRKRATIRVKKLFYSRLWR